MILSCFSERNFLIFVATAALFSLTFAYTAQHIYHVTPCSMCYYERYVYWTVALISIMGIASITWRTFFLRLLGLALVFGILLGLYHVGVEKHWWDAPLSCTGVPIAKSPEEFLRNLQNRPIARCDQVGWQIFDISATSLNLAWYCGFFFLWIVQRYLKVKSI